MPPPPRSKANKPDPTAALKAAMGATVRAISGKAGLEVTFTTDRPMLTSDKARLSNLMGIHKALRIIFREPQRGYAWIKKPNAAFTDKSALEVMLGGELTDLMRVRRYLDAERGTW